MKTSKERREYQKYCESLVARMVGNFPGLRQVNDLKGYEVDGADLTQWISNEIAWLEETRPEQFIKSYYRRNG
jgi:hypothetical protein